MSEETLGQAIPGATKTHSVTTAQGPDMEVRKATIAKGGTIPLHSHPFGQSHVVIKGEGTYMTSNGKVSVKPGFSNYAKPGEIHGWENTDSAELVFISSSSGPEGVYHEVANKWNIHYQS